ncbi:MAG: 23S rRNA (adenine(2503)-C(2))-methyltransferase RlmN [Bacillota bacterium]
MDKPQLLGMPLPELTSFVESLGERAFHARQIRSALLRGCTFGEMTELSKPFRALLEAHASTGIPTIVTKLESGRDETVKFLFALADGQAVESVLMAYKHGNTLCISTQVGCAMGCAFCASAVGGKVRDLSGSEMLGQVVAAGTYVRKTRELAAGRRAIDNVVLMGSGEPLDNFDNVVSFLRMLSDPEGPCLSLRHVSVSTCGLPQRMRALTDEGLSVTLCISLHAPNDHIRKKIMPVASAYPIEEVIKAARYHVQRTGRRVIFEYILIDGINDRIEHARELAARLRGLQCHVNLIAYNPVDHAGVSAPSQRAMQQFEQELTRAHISCTRRRVLGADIEGACGQLRRRTLENGAGGIKGDKA